MKKTRLFSLLILAPLLGACSDDSPTEVPPGTWGGKNVELQVDTQGATVLFKCGATGRLQGTLILDSSAHFSVGGTFDPKVIQGGPRPAQYSGTLSGTHLSLNLQVEQATQGPFDLQEGQQGSFEPCNFAS